MFESFTTCTTHTHANVAYMVSALARQARGDGSSPFIRSKKNAQRKIFFNDRLPHGGRVDIEEKTSSLKIF